MEFIEDIHLCKGENLLEDMIKSNEYRILRLMNIRQQVCPSDKNKKEWEEFFAFVTKIRPEAVTK